MMDFQHWLQQAIVRLAGSESPRRDAQILLETVTGRSRSAILAFGETPLSEEAIHALEHLLNRREAGEPMAYLLGIREFWSLPLRVSGATLIPRPDTECVVEQVLRCLPSSPATLLDLGTGTGAIALAIASERKDCLITGVDVVPEAVALARDNARRLGFSHVTILESNWFCALGTECFDLIVSNPPYIAEDDPHLKEGDVRFEPRSALVASDQGLADIAWLVHTAPAHLQPDGWLIIEHGWQQGDAVRQLFSAAGYTDVTTGRDYGGNERMTSGRRAN